MPFVGWDAMSTGAWTLAHCPPLTAVGLAAELGVSELTASVLVRRGLADAAAARAFLAGELPPHDPFLLGDMAAACERIRAAVARGERICVHGDYDVDGICATALSPRRRSSASRGTGSGSCSRSTAGSRPCTRSGRRGRSAST
jgi:hypothetical protein